MKIIFAGTPPFAVPALETLADAGHEIALVLTQPDRPAGRGMKPAASAVRLAAERHGFDLLQPSSLRQPELHALLTRIDADVMVVAAYGLILPESVLGIPRLGCLNIHASLLPRWRGAAPIQRAILAGDRDTGISIMQMDRGMDTGAILLQHPVAILPDDTAQTLHDRLASAGARCIVETLAQLQAGTIHGVVQDEAAAIYAPKLEKHEARIDWRSDAEQAGRAVRAFNPRPGAYTRIHGVLLKIWRADVVGSISGRPGEVVDAGRGGVLVACGRGGMVLKVVQKSGGKRMSVAEFLAGHALAPGDRFESGHDG
ncbi:methionyl-tRNA formyltransferase [Nitrosovibrio sp. Nv17]|jgi:methionyl-tRNA formyltransferase|uniref:methionyl-tRNA formyltransferase n=1 Tax=Nitrosovibrio sp. Nv17 TaxID=1855339 RepID=UPI000908E075|nr:methionyl-tRNA formyltransferase [Nitrosovibrio sp. Nv17]SFW11196.1 methionyl-tRNA formyltransferase [Nitrosovibrio sp. Nv17]